MALYIVSALALFKMVLLLILSKGNLPLVGKAIGLFFSTVTGKTATCETAPTPVKQDHHASFLWPLFLLQREARLMDFLLEDISGAPDELVGAGVREIHQKAKSFIREKMQITPIFSQEQGDPITVETGFNPSEVVLTGHFEGSPPFQGILCHHGWKVKADTIPAIPDWFNKAPLLAQAQIEIPQK